MRITNGLMSECGRYNGIGGNSMWFYVADNPDLDVELSIEGSIYAGRTGNLGVPVIFTGAEPIDSESRGVIALSCLNGSAGQYARVHMRTTVYVNKTSDGTSSLGNPREVNVSKTGSLRGDGLVKIFSGSGEATALNIYGELAPGSVVNPSATLTFDRTATNYSMDWTMHTNAVFRLEADADGQLPAVAGTLSGEFAPEVELDFPKSKSYKVTPIYSKSADGKTAYLDLKVSKDGLVVVVQ